MRIIQANVPGHVVASLLEFDHNFASVASLPPFLLRLFQELVRLFVSRALCRGMPLAITDSTHFRAAPSATCNLSAVFPADVGWLDPLSAFLGWTVDAIPCRILSKLAVPLLLESVVKQPLHVLQRNMLCRAALRGHVGWISDGESEASLEAAMAHAVAAAQLRRLC